jgi:hypothetical protein
LLRRFREFAHRSPENIGRPERAVVAKFVREIHQDWLHTPGKKGQQRNDNDLRRFMPEYKYLPDYKMGWLDPYYENWSSLEAASKGAE